MHDVIKIRSRLDEHPESWFWENAERAAVIPDGTYILVVDKNQGTLAIGETKQFLLSRVHNVSLEHGIRLKENG